MSNALKIGLIGLDTSHVPAFTKLLNDSTQEFHVPGGRVVAAFPGGSPDFDLSRDRVAGFTETLRTDYGVQMLDSPVAVAQACDAILLTSVDGRVHLSQFEQIAPLGKPVFIDKPFATSSADAHAIAELATRYHVPLMSCSSLRYAAPFVEALASFETPHGVDAYGPMAIQPTQGGLFWYGIHTVEMVYAALGRGCAQVKVMSNEDFDLVSAQWHDGRMASIRGNRRGNNTFGVVLHGAKTSLYANASVSPKPTYAGVLEQVMTMFQTGKSPIAIEETLEIVRFIEAANQSRESGEAIELK